MELEDWEKVQQYDLGVILEDRSFLSYEDLVQEIKSWWACNEEFILKACLHFKAKEET